MRRRLAVLAAVSALALALSASPALAGSPANHFPFSPVGVVLDCGANHYTIMSGTINVVLHSNDNFATGHETFRATGMQVQKNDEDGVPTGPFYRVVGTETHGVEAWWQTGALAAGATYKYQILGTGDSINIVTHVDATAPAGYYEVNHGTCDVPA